MARNGSVASIRRSWPARKCWRTTHSACRRSKRQLHFSRDATTRDAGEMGRANARAFPFRAEGAPAHHPLCQAQGGRQPGRALRRGGLLDGCSAGPFALPAAAQFQARCAAVARFSRDAAWATCTFSAFEFHRDKSWFDDSILQTLREGGAALCIAESETIASPIERTASFVYLRLRNEDYDATGLKLWADRISAMAAESEEIYIFFKHETHAPDRAFRLRELLAGAI